MSGLSLGLRRFRKYIFSRLPYLQSLSLFVRCKPLQSSLLFHTAGALLNREKTLHTYPGRIVSRTKSVPCVRWDGNTMGGATRMVYLRSFNERAHGRGDEDVSSGEPRMTLDHLAQSTSCPHRRQDSKSSAHRNERVKHGARLAANRTSEIAMHLFRARLCAAILRLLGGKITRSRRLCLDPSG